MAGRKPKPTHLKLLEGNPGKRAINKGEPKPTVKRPRCPEHLADEARREWNHMVKLLIPLGLLTEIDGTALAAYCQSYGRWVKAEKEIAETGEIVMTTNGNLIQNPYLAVANRAMKDMKAFLIEFGMTPSSRSRLNMKPAEKVDDYETFRNRRAASG